MFRVYIEDALANDLNDIPTIFGLSSQEGSPECFPVGSRGFWVAEEGNTIIGFVGLDLGASEEENIGEVRRMIVSPSHRRRGVGKELMDVVDKHAKANGIIALELTTSDFNVGALKMYKNNGWRLKRPRIYAGVLLHVLRKDL
ncbi:acyl-CoA N-acyltransferase [Collybia nuda]|uniref:Acyl-CoA N-acyltransferase n=1 Tax=Collybia nuda TaxID=64659 RepID=A0A9P5Y1Z5_9AGAR|nr:acyl-CoA N-acyltransferase [Collybia nuda]